jgi:hypothetical protein
VAASLVIEDFSLDRWQTAGRNNIEERMTSLRKMMQF